MESVNIGPSNGASNAQLHDCRNGDGAAAHTITRDDVKYYMGRVFDIPERRLEAMMSIVDNAQVHKRHSIFPIDYTVEPRRFRKPTRNTSSTPSSSAARRLKSVCSAPALRRTKSI